MAEPLLMGQYHDAVITSLKRLPWVRDADTYPEKDIPKFSGLITPAVYFTLNGCTNTGGSDGQLSVELDCDLFIVVDAAGQNTERPDIFLRSAMADITQWIDGQQFGLPHIEPAVFVSGERDEFDPRMDDYLVWRVNYSQVAAFGADPFPAGAPLKKIWLGEAPDIGTAHVDDYRLIWEAKDG